MFFSSGMFFLSSYGTFPLNYGAVFVSVENFNYIILIIANKMFFKTSNDTSTAEKIFGVS